MNIGILTFHNAHNYGAVLQCYALKRYLLGQGHSVEVINYKNPVIANVYREKLSDKYPLIDIIHMRRIPKLVKGKIDSLYAQKEWSVQYKKFERFIICTLLDGKAEEVKSIPVSGYDALIAGSDQIWNASLTGGIDPVYLLNFQTDARKIFYGASNGIGTIPEEQIAIYKKALKSAFAISTREQKLADDIIKRLGYPTVGVVDPTLLISRLDYVNLIGSSKNMEKFIFTYFVSEDKTLSEASQYLSRVLRMPSIELHYYKTKKMKGQMQRADMGPEDFLWHVDNAEYILTNSFHGTVFALLFHKPFFCVYGNDVRKDTLLEQLSCQTRHLRTLTEIDLNNVIDYQLIDEKLAVMRMGSEQFLKKALEQ